MAFVPPRQFKRAIFILIAALMLGYGAKNVSAQTSTSAATYHYAASDTITVDVAPSSASAMLSPTLPNDGANPNTPGLPDNGTNPNAPNITAVAWEILGGILALLIVIFFLTRKKK
jgi:hypothetical protein